MSQTSDENEEGVFSQNQSGLSLSDDENNNEKLGWGVNLKKGPWTSAEDAILMDYVKQHGEGSWNSVQKHSGLFRCGKSCRLRWANHLRPNLKKGAFSAEEERLIIELHAKMGNKWARMAAHLPGRTDNEIKNYWNTRIKRRQRAGLPLYPPELCWEVFHESQSQNIDGINCGDKRPHSLLQSNSYEIPDIFFNGIKDNQDIIPYFPDLPEIHSSSFTKGFGSSSQYWRFMPPAMDRQKGFRESMQFDQGQEDTSIKNECYFGPSFPYDHDSITKYHLPFGANQGSHSLINNGNFSASKPRSGAVKSELPSLQYPETDFSSWGTSFVPQPILESVDDFIQSPQPTGTVKSERDSIHNSGLLDALLYESKTLGNAKNHSSDKNSDTSTIVTPCDVPESSTLNIFEPEWEDYGDSTAPFGHSASETSIFSECTPISGGGSSLDECTHIEAFLGQSVKLEPVDHVSTPDNDRETSAHFSRPDALLGSYWVKQSSGCDNEQTVKTDAISQLLGSDCGADYKGMGFGTSRGFDSFGWNNMRSACQMSDLP